MAKGACVWWSNTIYFLFYLKISLVRVTPSPHSKTNLSPINLQDLLLSYLIIIMLDYFSSTVSSLLIESCIACIYFSIILLNTFVDITLPFDIIIVSSL